MITTVEDDYKIEILSTALKCVSSVFDISEEAIKGPSRKRDISHARQAYAALVVREYNAAIPDEEKIRKIKLSDIGGFVNKDHATILYSSGVAHENNMSEKNADYNPFYSKARVAFLDETERHFTFGARRRVNEIDVELSRLSSEKTQLLLAAKLKKKK